MKMMRRIGFPRGDVYGSRIFAERQDREVAWAGPSSDVSVCGAGDACSGRSGAMRSFCGKNLHCNIVRTSHYPQSRHFLDCCDEIGLLVLEEIPGWQHIGPEPWKQISIDNVGRMIRRDWNHPSIVLWGVRINESQGRSRLLRSHECFGASARSHSPDGRDTVLPGVGVLGRCVHHERLRVSVEKAESSSVSEHGVCGAYLSDEDDG